MDSVSLLLQHYDLSTNPRSSIPIAFTTLHTAASYGQTEIIKFICENHAYGNLTIDIHAHHYKTAITELHLKYENLEIEQHMSFIDFMALYVSSQYGQVQALDKLLKQNTYCSQEAAKIALNAAVECGNTETVEFLLKHPLSYSDTFKENALYATRIAAEHGHLRMLIAS